MHEPSVARAQWQNVTPTNSTGSPVQLTKLFLSESRLDQIKRERSARGHRRPVYPCIHLTREGHIVLATISARPVEGKLPAHLEKHSDRRPVGSKNRCLFNARNEVTAKGRKIAQIHGVTPNFDGLASLATSPDQDGLS